MPRALLVGYGIAVGRGRTLRHVTIHVTIVTYWDTTTMRVALRGEYQLGVASGAPTG